MKKIAFIGGYDKSDMLIYMGKIISLMGKKPLIVDSTTLQKTRYIVPTMQAEKQYINTFEKVDIAIGFETFEQIKRYKEVNDSDKFDYDYALIDIDSFKGYYNFKVKPEDKHYFVTAFDLYSLRRGLQIFKRLEAPVNVTKILFTRDMIPEENNYLNFLSKSLKIKWDEDIVYFPFEHGDQNIIYTNQRSGRIKVSGLSMQYMDGMMYIVEEITGSGQGEVRKATKILEKN